MKNAFHFISKALSVLKTFKFVSRISNQAVFSPWPKGQRKKTAWLERQG